MLNKKNTKAALIYSLTSMLICMSMLVGSTFAWFTDSASTGTTTIISGNLDVGLEILRDGVWVDARYAALQLANSETGETDAWSPGESFVLPDLRIVNNGGIAIKCQIKVNGLLEDDNILNEAIEWTYEIINENEEIVAEHYAYALPAEVLKLNSHESSSIIRITGTMIENADPKYQGKSISDVSITLLAAQSYGEF